MADTYRRGCNTIESRNALLKNGRMGLGDKPRRLVRGCQHSSYPEAPSPSRIRLEDESQ